MKSFVMNRNFFQCQKKFLKKKKFAQHDVENKQLEGKNEQFVAKDATIKEAIKKPIQIKNPKEDINTKDYPNWFDKNKLKNISYYWQQQI